MYAILTTFTLLADKHETADKLGDQWQPVLSSLEGFKSATMCGDAETGEYAALTLWETKEDAEAAVAATEAGFQRSVVSIAMEPPIRRVYEIRRMF